MPGILDIDLFFLHGFPDGLWNDVMLGIVQDLQIPAPFWLVDRPFHRICHDVGIQHYLCIDIPCSTPDDLDQAPGVTEEPFLIRIEDTDEPDFRDVEAFPQEIDTDKHIELPEPELPYDLASFEGLDLRMKVSCPYALVCEKLGEFFSKFLGERGDEYAIAPSDGCLHLPDDIVCLALNRPDFYHGVDQAGRADDLFNHLDGFFHLVIAGCCRHNDHVSQ